MEVNPTWPWGQHGLNSKNHTDLDYQVIVLFRTCGSDILQLAEVSIRARTDNYPVLVTSDKKCQTLERDDKEPLQHRSRKTNKTNGMTACPFLDRHLGPNDRTAYTTSTHYQAVAYQRSTTVLVSYHLRKERTSLYM